MQSTIGILQSLPWSLKLAFGKSVPVISSLNKCPSNMLLKKYKTVVFLFHQGIPRLLSTSPLSLLLIFPYIPSHAATYIPSYSAFFPCNPLRVPIGRVSPIWYETQALPDNRSPGLLSRVRAVLIGRSRQRGEWDCLHHVISRFMALGFIYCTAFTLLPGCHTVSPHRLARPDDVPNPYRPVPSHPTPPHPRSFSRCASLSAP